MSYPSTEEFAKATVATRDPATAPDFGFIYDLVADTIDVGPDHHGRDRHIARLFGRHKAIVTRLQAQDHVANVDVLASAMLVAANGGVQGQIDKARFLAFAEAVYDGVLKAWAAEARPKTEGATSP